MTTAYVIINVPGMQRRNRDRRWTCVQSICTRLPFVLFCWMNMSFQFCWTNVQTSGQTCTSHKYMQDNDWRSFSLPLLPFALLLCQTKRVRELVYLWKWVEISSCSRIIYLQHMNRTQVILFLTPNMPELCVYVYMWDRFPASSTTKSGFCEKSEITRLIQTLKCLKERSFSLTGLS